MDRWHRHADEYSPAMRTGSAVTAGFVLRACGRERGESRADAAAGRAVPADAVLRRVENDRLAGQARTCRQFETSAAVDAADGAGGNLCQTAIVQSSARASYLSVPVAGISDRKAERVLGDRHHLHSFKAGLCIPGGDYGLVQPLCPVVGSVDQSGIELLRDRAGLGIEESEAGHLQLRSRRTVHQPGIHESFIGSRDRDQHGWQGTRAGQRLCLALVAHRQVRRHLFEGLSGCRCGDRRITGVLSILQSRALTSGSGLSNTGGSLLPSAEEGSRPTGRPGSRPNSRSSFIGDPGATFVGARDESFHKERKRSKKKEKFGRGRPVETAAAVEINKGSLRRYFLYRFPLLLEKACAKNAPAFSQLRTGPTTVTLSTHFQWQRSTLRKATSCLKNGEYLTAQDQEHDKTVTLHSKPPHDVHA